MQRVPNWKLAHRSNYLKNAIFKTKRIDQDKLLLHIPINCTIRTLDLSLRDLGSTYTFQEKLNAIEYFSLNGRDVVLAGLNTGKIEAQYADDRSPFCILQQTVEQISINGNYINDMLHLGGGRVVNCYNNGSLAFWDLNRQEESKMVAFMQKVHANFTYKLRRVDQTSIVSCGHDGAANIIDIERQTVDMRLAHPDSVWCSYPVTDNLIVSAGLFEELLFWDLRSERLVQRCGMEENETSFITRLNENSLVLGDGSNLVQVDLRMPKREVLSGSLMMESAETIIVTETGGIVGGRGGDLCKFVDTDQEVEMSMDNVMVQPMPMANPLSLWFNLLRRGNDDEDNWEDMEQQFNSDEEDM